MKLLLGFYLIDNKRTVRNHMASDRILSCKY